VKSLGTRLQPQYGWGGSQDDYSFIFRNWLEEQQKNQVKVEDRLPEGASSKDNPVEGLKCGTGTALLTVNAGPTRNDKSMVLRIVHNKFSATLTGDATGESLASILENISQAGNGAITTTLLSAPHHGAVSDGSNSFLWQQVFKPEIVVFSAGERYFHPRCEALLTYARGNTIQNANKHPMQCGEDGAYWLLDLEKAQYLTESNGDIWVTSNGETATEVTCDAVINDNQRVNCQLVHPIDP
jgi:hypothetical protein